MVLEASKGCDVIFHFAAVLGVDIVADNPVETMDVEVVGTRNVVEASETNNVKYILYASTSGIYSHSAIVKNALTEEVMVDPRTSYAMAKRYNEIYLASHHEERGINVISILRRMPWSCPDICLVVLAVESTQWLSHECYNIL